MLPEAQDVPKSRGGRRLGIGLGVTVLVLAVLAGAAWVADGIFRGMAEDAAASAIEAQLPEGVSADLHVSIGGGLFLPQLLAGSFAEVTITTDDASYKSVGFDAVVRAEGVPTDVSGTVRHVDARVTLDEDAVNELLALPGTDPHLSLGESTVTYEDATRVLGFEIGYTVTARASAEDSTVTLAPEHVKVTSPLGSLNLDDVVGRVLDKPVAVCVADRLPAVVDLDGIAVEPGSATLTLTAAKLPLDAAALGTPGSCDAG